MASNTGTTTSKAAGFVGISRRSRPATDGNTNVKTGSQSSMTTASQVPVSNDLAGPDKGRGQVFGQSR